MTLRCQRQGDLVMEFKVAVAVPCWFVLISSGNSADYLRHALSCCFLVSRT